MLVINMGQIGSSFQQIDKSSEWKEVRQFTAQVKSLHSAFSNTHFFPLYVLLTFKINPILQYQQCFLVIFSLSFSVFFYSVPGIHCILLSMDEGEWLWYPSSHWHHSNGEQQKFQYHHPSYSVIITFWSVGRRAETLTLVLVECSSQFRLITI